MLDLEMASCFLLLQVIRFPDWNVQYPMADLQSTNDLEKIRISVYIKGKLTLEFEEESPSSRSF